MCLEAPSQEAEQRDIRCVPPSDHPCTPYAYPVSRKQEFEYKPLSLDRDCWVVGLGALELPTQLHLTAAFGRWDSGFASQTGTTLSWFMPKKTGDFWYDHNTRRHLPVPARVIENDQPNFIKISACLWCGLLPLHAQCELWFLGTQQ